MNFLFEIESSSHLTLNPITQMILIYENVLVIIQFFR